MKALGVKQFLQKKFEYIELEDGPLKRTIGKLVKSFFMIVYGYSGNGKTEFVLILAKELARLGLKVAWLSYEQGHDADLQIALDRNNMDEVSGNFIPYDPNEDMEEGDSYCDDILRMINKRNSADVLVVDSLDYTELSYTEYKALKKICKKKNKALIFLSHSDKKGKPYLRIATRIMFDGGFGFWVSDFIAHVEKNRFGGTEPFVIHEKEAKLRNPAFFVKRKKEEKKALREGNEEASTEGHEAPVKTLRKRQTKTKQ